jgi:hypothetical protein
LAAARQNTRFPRAAHGLKGKVGAVQHVVAFPLAELGGCVRRGRDPVCRT